jgi:hypothetical protein
MKFRKWLTLLLLLISPLVGWSLGKQSNKDKITWCQIDTPHHLQEAQFTAVFAFETDQNGKPVNIRKVLNPFLASFQWKWGWTEIEVKAKGLKKSLP